MGIPPEPIQIKVTTILSDVKAIKKEGKVLSDKTVILYLKRLTAEYTVEVNKFEYGNKSAGKRCQNYIRTMIILGDLFLKSFN